MRGKTFQKKQLEIQTEFILMENLNISIRNTNNEDLIKSAKSVKNILKNLINNMKMLKLIFQVIIQLP